MLQSRCLLFVIVVEADHSSEDPAIGHGITEYLIPVVEPSCVVAVENHGPLVERKGSEPKLSATDAGKNDSNTEQ